MFIRIRFPNGRIGYKIVQAKKARNDCRRQLSRFAASKSTCLEQRLSCKNHYNCDFSVIVGRETACGGPKSYFRCMHTHTQPRRVPKQPVKHCQAHRHARCVHSCFSQNKTGPHTRGTLVKTRAASNLLGQGPCLPAASEAEALRQILAKWVPRTWTCHAKNIQLWTPQQREWCCQEDTWPEKKVDQKLALLALARGTEAFLANMATSVPVPWDWESTANPRSSCKTKRIMKKMCHLTSSPIAVISARIASIRSDRVGEFELQ